MRSFLDQEMDILVEVYYIVVTDNEKRHDTVHVPARLSTSLGPKLYSAATYQIAL
jgi:hypothetical protein